YRGHGVGWLLLVGQLGSGIGIAADALLVLMQQGVVNPQVRWLVQMIQALFDAPFSVATISVAFMLAPDGRLLSRWWRLAVVLPIAAGIFRLAGAGVQFVADIPLGSVVFDGGILTVMFFASF